MGLWKLLNKDLSETVYGRADLHFLVILILMYAAYGGFILNDFRFRRYHCYGIDAKLFGAAALAGIALCFISLASKGKLFRSKKFEAATWLLLAAIGICIAIPVIRNISGVPALTHQFEAKGRR